VAAVNDIEWLHPDDEPTPAAGRVEVGVTEARALVVGPDEVLVVVFPQWAGPEVLNMHRIRLAEVLGNRFLLVAGGDIRLAKVQSSDWAPRALEGPMW
jgi:hypothetical protein